MQSTKEKISNMASAAKKNMTICRAKVEEKVEKAGARTYEQRQIATERRKAKEAQAKMELHQAKARHAAQKSRQQHLHPHPHTAPVVGANQPLGTTAPAYPLGGHPPGLGHKYL